VITYLFTRINGVTRIKMIVGGVVKTQENQT